MKKIDRESVPFPAAPDGLSARSVALWAELGPSRADIAGRRVLLEQALRALDSAEAARAAIERDGRTFKTKSGVVHSNPEVKLEIESRRQFAALWRDLGLNHAHVTSSLDSLLR